jgi:hypothetical protein
MDGKKETARFRLPDRFADEAGPAALDIVR